MGLAPGWPSGKDDLSQHSNGDLWWNGLATLHHSMHLLTNGGSSFGLLSVKGVDIQIDEALANQFLSDILLDVVSIGTWSDVDNSWLVELSNFFNDLLGGSLSINGLQFGADHLLEVR